MNLKNAQPVLEGTAPSVPHLDSKRGIDGAMPSNRAFTLVELMVVLATLALLAALLLPALANTGPDSAAAQCRSNQRQLMVAWAMYSDDNRDVLPLNTDQSASLGTPPNLYPPWASGILDWTSSTANTNGLYVTDPRASSLARYGGAKASLFRCPSDNYLSAVQRAARYQFRARSISMDGAVGGGNPTQGQQGYKPAPSLVPPLLANFFYAVKRSQLVSPGPASSWVLIDENPDSLDDSIYYSDPYATNGLGQFTELPSSSHDGGATVSFGDGHVEIHRWTDSRTAHAVTYTAFQRVNISGQPSADLAWLAQHTPRAP